VGGCQAHAAAAVRRRSTVKHGFCRGGEALILTENIRNYYDILSRFEEPHVPGFTLFATAEDEEASAATAVR
jgi:membrane-bound lytic murein transglycosylase F